MFGSYRRTNKNSAPPSGGADFGKLPPQVRQDVMEDVDGDDQSWVSLSQYVESKLAEAPPGQKLALLRTCNNLSQAQVAKAANLRQADVSDAERNIDEVKVGMLHRIAKVLGLRVIINFVRDDGVPDGIESCESDRRPQDNPASGIGSPSQEGGNFQP